MDAVTDRTWADIIARAAKAFFNVADWMRIDDNSQTVLAAIEAAYDITVPRITTTTPTAGDFVSVDDINDLVANIEALRIAAALPAAAGVQVLTYDYTAGVNAVVPNYTDVNAWEQNLVLMDELVPYAAGYLAYCGVPAAGQDRFWQAQFRG